MGNNKAGKIKTLSLAGEFLSWKTIAAVIVAFLIIYALFRGFKRADLITFIDYFHRMNIPAFALGFVSYYIAYLFLGLRYRILLGNCGVKISLWRAALTCFMGAAINAGLPTKVGDFYRAYLLHKHSNVPVGQGLGANIGERIFDLTFLLGLFIVMSHILFGHGSNVIVNRLIVSGLYLLGLVVLVLVLLLVPATRNSILAVFPVKVRVFVTQFADGVTGSLGHNWFWLIAATVGLWAMESLRLYFVTVALGAHLTIPQIIFTVTATTLLASIPVSFSGLGFVEGGMTGLLKLFRIDTALGLATILGDRLISFVSVLILGFLSFLFVKDAS